MTKTASSRATSQTGPATRLIAVAPSDQGSLPTGITRSLYVGGAGQLRVRDAAGNEVTLVSGAGQYHPLQVAQILATGTTATGIVALY